MKPKLFFAIILFMLFGGAVNANTCVKPPEQNNIDTRKINGIVIDMDSKKPLKDVNITAILQSKKEKVVSTDINGGYTIIMLKPGTYKLIFEKDGYKKIVKDKVEIKENIPLQINIEMPEYIPVSDRGPSAWHFFES